MGYDRAGGRCLAQCEVDERCRQVLRRHWPEAELFGDVTAVEPSNIEALGPCDVWHFSSPCQGLSVAGKNKGFNGDPRSALFREVIRLLRDVDPAYRPRFAVWENVAGVLNSTHRRDFAEVVASFCELGARDVAWRVLDSQGFGVPQRRRRVFLVADFAGESAASVLFDPPGGSGHHYAPQAQREGGADSSRSAGDPRSPGGTAYGFDAQFSMTDIGVEVAPTLCVSTRKAVAMTVDMGGGKGSAGIAEELSPTLSTGSPHALISYGLTQQQTSVLPEGVPTLTVGSDVLLAQPEGVLRFLTPVECCRLMGWPDDHNEWGVDEAGRRVEISASARYKQCGNGVVACVTEWIGWRVARVQG